MESSNCFKFFIIYVVYELILTAAQVPYAPTLIYTKGNSICSYNISTPDLSEIQRQNENCFWTMETKRPVVLGMLVASNKVIFATREYMSRADLSTAINAKTLGSSAGIISDISVDWISENIYYTDLQRNSINVMTMEGEYSVTILKDLTGLHGMTVDPIGRYIFWTTYGTNIHSRIGRSRLDGTEKNINFFSTGSSSPFYLCYDHTGDRLYWTNRIEGTIDSIDRYGRNYRRVVTATSKNIYAIAVSRDHIMWTENTFGSNYSGIYWSSKSSGATVASISHFTLDSIYDILYYSDYSQPRGANACSGPNNGGCSQICIPVSANGNTCRCSLGYEKNINGKSCDPVPPGNKYNSLYVADNGRGLIFSLDTVTRKVAVIPTQKHVDIVEIVVDPILDMLIWADRGDSTIKKCNLDGSGLSVIIKFNDHNIDGLAIDYVKQLIFYCDYTSNLVESISYNGQNRKLIHRENVTMSIVTHAKEEKLYFSTTENNPRIGRMNYDGSGMETIIRNVKYPEGLTIDYKTETLYWVDTEMETIESAKTDGTNRKTLHSTYTYADSFMTDLALLGGYIYVADWGKRDHQLKRIPLQLATYRMEDFGTDEFLYTYAITAYPSDVYKTTTTTTTDKRTVTATSTTDKVTVITTSTTIKSAQYTQTPISGDDKNDGPDLTTIIGVTIGVIGLIAAVSLVAVAFYCIYKLRNKATTEQESIQNPGEFCIVTVGNSKQLKLPHRAFENAICVASDETTDYDKISDEYLRPL